MNPRDPHSRRAFLTWLPAGFAALFAALRGAASETPRRAPGPVDGVFKPAAARRASRFSPIDQTKSEDIPGEK